MIQNVSNKNLSYEDNGRVLWPFQAPSVTYYFIPNTPGEFQMTEYHYEFTGSGRISKGYSGPARKSDLKKNTPPEFTVAYNGTGKEGNLRIWYEYKNPTTGKVLSDSLRVYYSSFSKRALEQHLLERDEQAYLAMRSAEQVLIIRAILSIPKRYDFDITLLGTLTVEQLYDRLRSIDLFVHADTYKAAQKMWATRVARRDQEIRITFQFQLF